MSSPMHSDVHLTEVDYDPFATPELARAVPTTDAQRELWLADQLGREASLAFNESISLDIGGTLRVQEFQDSLLALSDRHESLRSTIAGDGMNMLIAPRGALQAEIVDLSGQSAAEQEREAARRREAAVLEPFDLVHGPLVRATLLCLAPDRHEFILSAHHIVCDGWSFAVLARDLMRIYAGLCSGRGTADLPQVDSFGDYALGEHDPALAEQATADERYWVSVFDRGVPTLDLPTDRPRRSVRSFASRREDFRIEPALVEAARKLGAANGASLFATLFGLFGALMSRLGADESGEVVVGVPSAGQAARDANELVGHCVNLLPVRMAVDPAEPVGVLLRRAGTAVLDAYEHQSCTFGRLLSKLAITRDASRLPLVSVQFNIDSPIAPADLAAPGVDVSLRANPRAFENFELFVNATQTGGAIVLECQYNTDLFDAETVQRWLDLYREVLERAVAQPTQAVGQLFGATRADRERLAAFNATAMPYPADQRIEALVSAQVARTPDAVAIVAGDSRLTYRELEQRANAVAAALAERGVGAGQLVGMACGRNVGLLAGMLGILKTGAAYVPLDPAFPEERLVHMAEDAALACVVTDRTVTLPALARFPTLHVDELAPRADCPCEARDVQAAAYVIYTSGSTGKPKGVAVPQRAVSNFLASMAREPGLRPDDRLVAVTTTSFDIAVLELFLPLTLGAQVIIADRESVLDGQRLRALIEKHDATVLQATPSGWRVLIEAGWVGHGRFKALVGGEPLGDDLAEQLIERTGETWNMYGPTETTVWSTCWRVPRQRQGIRIGAPIANTQIHVLDARFAPCPIGVPGEIFIGGDGVAIGYLKREELTAERFIADPAAPGERIYRTGDRGRWRNDGMLEHMGRLDFQVKVRGYRIELGEIEANLARHPGVGQCVVIVREDSPGDPRIVAYVVPRGEGVKARDAKEFLKRTLPDYMVPHHFVELGEIPLLPNGKVDRKRLPHPSATAARGPVLAPRTDMELMVVRTMQQVLSLPSVGVDENFFSLGGHSLLAAQLAARLSRETGEHVPMRLILTHPTAEQLARALEHGALDQTRSKRPPLRRLVGQSEAPLTLMQESMRFAEELYPGRVLYNTPSAHRLAGALDLQAFRTAFGKMVDRQAALRTQIVRRGDGFVQEVLPHLDVELALEDLSGLAAEAREAELMQRLQRRIDDPIAIASAPLFRVGLYRLSPTEHVFFFMAHHIIWDGWSFDLMYEEMSELYAAEVEKRESRLAKPSHSLVDFSVWFGEWLASEDCADQLGYWKKKYAAMPGTALVPTDRPRRAGGSASADTEWVNLDEQITRRLHAIASQQGCTLNTVVLSLYALVLAELVGDGKVVLGVPVRGRVSQEFDPVMGFFVNVVPTVIPQAFELSFESYIGRVQQELTHALSHQDVPLERLLQEPEFDRFARGAPVYQSMFSFQDVRMRPRHWGPLQHSSLPVMQKGSPAELGLWLLEWDTGLSGGITYDSGLFDAASIRLLRDRLQGLALRAVAGPGQSLRQLIESPGSDRDDLQAWLRRAGADRGAAGEAGAGAIAAPSERADAPATMSLLESQLAMLWAELLGVPVSDIGVADNFFDLGGSSLLAMRFVEQAGRRLGVRIEPQRVVAGTLRQVAERAEAVEALASADEAKEQAQSKGVFARLFRRGGR